MKKTMLMLAALLAVRAGSTLLHAANPIVPDGAKLEKLFTRTADIEGGLTEGPALAKKARPHRSEAGLARLG